MLRFYHMDKPVSSRKRPVETTRRWISGLAITLTTLIALFGFWRLSPGVTLVIATIALVVLGAILWFERDKPE